MRYVLEVYVLTKGSAFGWFSCSKVSQLSNLIREKNFT